MINQEKSLISRILPHGLAIIGFLIITIVYFSPVFMGKVLPQHDTTQYRATAKELSDYYQNEGQTSEWIGSMFSGMPAYQIGVHGGSPNFLDYLEKPFNALGHKDAGPLFMGMLMAYLMFVVMGFRPSIAVLGAIAYGLSSYNIIIIAAGHVTKAWVIAYMPMVVAGMMALFKNKILLSGLLIAFGLALQLKNNHLQITFYTGLLCVVLYVYYTVITLMKKEVKTWLKASGVLVAAVTLGILCNLGNIYANYEMGKTSIRGKSDLTISLIPKTENENSADAGIDKDKEYAFAWSYGKAETLTLLVPNVYGGASKGYDESSKSYNALLSNGVPADNAQNIRQSIPQYWGEQSFTSGPVYFGAIICFLFVLGMIIIKDRMKWVLFGATLFFLFLSWGSNFIGFNDWFYYNFPFYNKFRAVSMALVMPAITMLIIAIWGIKEFLEGNTDKKKLTKALYISTGIVGFLCFILWVAPTTFFNFTSQADDMWKTQLPDWYYNAIIQDRKDLLTADAFRSLVYIILTAAILWITLQMKSDKQKIGTYASLAIAILVLSDLWGIDKRYLNSDSFEDKNTYQNNTFKKTVADDFILRDTHPSYRVLKIGNPFNDAGPSYYHKSIGGYHAAKLKRYQEMIEFSLGNEVSMVQNESAQIFNSQLQKLQQAHQQGLNPDFGQLSVIVSDSIAPLLQKATVMNMLNTKYIIFHPELPPIINPYAMGNAWFVSEYELVDTPDDEIKSLKTLNPLQKAIISKKDEAELNGLNIVPDSSATITLTEYKPNRLTYKSKTANEQLAIFSEIFYANGWQAYIDGTPAPHYCADWTLRAMRIPAGEHEIVFKFEPHDYWTARHIATASSGILVLLLIGALVSLFLDKKRDSGKKASKTA